LTSGSSYIPWCQPAPSVIYEPPSRPTRRNISIQSWSLNSPRSVRTRSAMRCGTTSIGTPGFASRAHSSRSTSRGPAFSAAGGGWVPEQRLDYIAQRPKVGTVSRPRSATFGMVRLDRRHRLPRSASQRRDAGRPLGQPTTQTTNARTIARTARTAAAVASPPRPCCGARARPSAANTSPGTPRTNGSPVQTQVA